MGSQGPPIGPPIGFQGISLGPIGSQPIGFQGHPIGSQVSPIGFQGPPMGSQGPPTSSQGPPMGSQGPPIGSQGPPTGFLGPPTGSQGPPMGSQGPPTGFQGPPTGSQGAASGPPIGYQGTPPQLALVPSFPQAATGLPASSHLPQADAPSDMVHVTSSPSVPATNYLVELSQRWKDSRPGPLRPAARQAHDSRMHLVADELEKHKVWQEYGVHMARYIDHVKECREANVPTRWRAPPTPPLERSDLSMEQVLRWGGLEAHDSDADTTAAGFEVLDL